MKKWTTQEDAILRQMYPASGKAATAKALGRTLAMVRSRAARLGIKADKSSAFFNDWQSRAASSKVGKKRPAQSAVMKRTHAEGKLKKTPEQSKATSERLQKHNKEHGHPRGSLGMRHTPEALEKISSASKKQWAELTQKESSARTMKMLQTRVRNGTNVPDRRRGSWKASWRTIGGKKKFFRSRWEANYARFLEWQKQQKQINDWHHEPETFWFKGVRRGCVSYLPDFRVTLIGGSIEFHEVKGWMDARSKTKIKRMKKYHPSVCLVVIDSKAYRDIAKLFAKAVPDWE